MDNLLRILQHALGLDEHGQGKPYRNHFVAGAGNTDFEACTQAVGRGLMIRHIGTAISGWDDVFTVTEAGRAYVREHSPPPPKRTRGQRRYDAWLEEESSETFGEWLKRGRYRACNA